MQGEAAILPQKMKKTKSKRINPISRHFLKAWSNANAKAMIPHFDDFFSLQNAKKHKS